MRTLIKTRMKMKDGSLCKWTKCMCLRRRKEEIGSQIRIIIVIISLYRKPKMRKNRKAASRKRRRRQD